MTQHPNGPSWSQTNQALMQKENYFPFNLPDKQSSSTLVPDLGLETGGGVLTVVMTGTRRAAQPPPLPN